MNIDLNKKIYDLSYNETEKFFKAVKNLCIDFDDVFIQTKYEESELYIRSSDNPTKENSNWKKIETLKEFIEYFSEYYSEKIVIKYLIQINRNPINL